MLTVKVWKKKKPRYTLYSISHRSKEVLKSEEFSGQSYVDWQYFYLRCLHIEDWILSLECTGVYSSASQSLMDHNLTAYCQSIICIFLRHVVAES